MKMKIRRQAYACWGAVGCRSFAFDHSVELISAEFAAVGQAMAGCGSAGRSSPGVLGWHQRTVLSE
jgi:hypothetical protein